MKKYLWAVLLAIIMSVGSSFTDIEHAPSIAYAADVFVCHGPGADYYLEDDTIVEHNDKYFSVHVKNGMGNRFSEEQFDFFLNEDDVWCYTRSLFEGEAYPVSFSRIAQAIFEACQAYL